MLFFSVGSVFLCTLLTVNVRETTMADDYGSATIDVSGFQNGEQNLSENLEYWMTRLPPRLRALPIIQLAIPGSHNSMTYTIDRNNDIGPDEPNAIRRMGRMAKPVIFNWSVNQHETIREQLDGGIRYLDLRVASKNTDGKIYFLHGLYGEEISQPLQDVSDWLSMHPNEAIIMDFQHFYDMDETHHRNLIDQIKYIFRGKMCPVYSKFDQISLQWLNLEKNQVFVIYRNIIARNYNDLWPSGLWPTPWPNTVNPSRLINFLNDGLKSRVREHGYVSQCLLTPNSTYIVKHLCGNLFSNLYPKCRGATFQWIDENSPGTGGMNIVITDYISFSNYLFPRTVIQRNAALLKLNTYYN